MKPSKIKETKGWELALRFAFGGAITAGTGLIAKGFGPIAAGLFLAFPAILPASLTLVARHAGRAEASDDAKGAACGSVGLAVFGLIVWRFADRAPAVIVLAAATAAWLVVSVAVWWVFLAAKGRNYVEEDSRDPARRPSALHGASRGGE